MVNARQLDLLAESNAQAVASVRFKVLATVRALWISSPAFRDVDVDRLVARLVPMVEAGKVKVAELTSVYLAQEAALIQGVRFDPAQVDRKAIREVRGIAPMELYRRPASTLYASLSEGKPFLSAKEAGLNRLISIVGTDLQLAKNWQARDSFAKSRTEYFQRRLSGSENCALCVVAATQRYKTDQLSPMHPGCDCGVRALRGDKDPKHSIDPASLEMMHALVKEKFGMSDRGGRAPDYRQIMVVQQHGEMGPVLSWRGAKFTGPDDLS